MALVLGEWGEEKENNLRIFISTFFQKSVGSLLSFWDKLAEYREAENIHISLQPCTSGFASKTLVDWCVRYVSTFVLRSHEIQEKGVPQCLVLFFAPGEELDIFAILSGKNNWLGNLKLMLRETSIWVLKNNYCLRRSCVYIFCEFLIIGFGR